MEKLGLLPVPGMETPIYIEHRRAEVRLEEGENGQKVKDFSSYYLLYRKVKRERLIRWKRYPINQCKRLSTRY